MANSVQKEVDILKKLTHVIMRNCISINLQLCEYVFYKNYTDHNNSMKPQSTVRSWHFCYK